MERSTLPTPSREGIMVAIIMPAISAAPGDRIGVIDHPNERFWRLQAEKPSDNNP